MAKLFYTLEETAAKLGKSADEISSLVEAGKLREFRDHEGQLMFKIQEVDLLAGDSGGSMELDLGEDLTLPDDGSMGLDLTDSTLGTDQRAGSGAKAPPAEDAGGGLDDLALDLDEAPASQRSKADDLALDLGGSGSAKAAGDSAAPLELDLDAGAPAAKAGEDMTLELDLEGASAKQGGSDLDLDLDLESTASAKSGGGEALGLDLDTDETPAKPAAEEDPFALDLDESPAAAPKAPAGRSGSPKPSASEEATLELDLGEEPMEAPAPAAKGSPLADSLGSIAAAKAASGAGDDLALDGSNVGATSDGSSIADRIGIDGVSSGSGLMDLTNESESSSIGAALMDEAFSSEEGGELPANASGIFGGSEGGESGAEMAPVGAAAGAAAAAAVAGKGKARASAPIFTSGPAATEAYSGSWSGLGVGMLLPASLGLGAAASMVAAKAMGAPPQLAVEFAKDWTMYTGALAGAIVVSGVIGFFVGKATE